MALQSLGHQAEDFLLMAVQRIGITVVDRTVVHQNLDCDFAIARATEREDWQEKTDFWFYIRTRGWKRLDLSTARKPEIVNKKRSQKVCAFFVNFRTLELAARGCEKDLYILESIFVSLVKEFAQ